MTAHGIQATFTRMMAPFLDRSRGLLLFLFFVIGLGLAGPGLPRRTMAGAHFGQEITVRAEGMGTSAPRFSEGREVLTDFVGRPDLAALLRRNQAEPLAMASADFDEDGVPDLVVGYAGRGAGVVSLLRGNVDALYRDSPEAKQRKASGAFTDTPFLSPALVYALAQTPHFLGAGDFDGDGHWDLVVAQRDGDKLALLSGDGKGELRPSREIELPGTVLALTAGEINRRDGLADIIVGINRAGRAQVMVFEDPHGAFRATPEILDLHVEAESMALALDQLDDDVAIDLAIAAGARLWVAPGRDRKLSFEESIRKSVAPPQLGAPRVLQASVQSIATGRFHDRAAHSVAVLLADGSLYLPSPERDHQASSIEEDESPAIGPWPNATSLLGARVSGQSRDDLFVIGEELHLTGFVGDGGLRNATSFATKRPLIAALSMRLNQDALSDLVVLQKGRTSVSVITTTFASRFVVNTTQDHPPDGCDDRDCTLREAILAANETTDLDEIVFDIKGQAPPYTIKLQIGGASLIIQNPVFINGNSQQDRNGKPAIEIDYSESQVGIGGISIVGAGDSVVRGLVMYTSRTLEQGDWAAIYTERSSNNRIEGNYLGLDAQNQHRTRGYSGVFIGAGSAGNKIGGTAPGARNVIAGHRFNIASYSGKDSRVQGNFIGTDLTGARPLVDWRGGNGILFSGAGNLIGGTDPGARNVISAGNHTHIWLYNGNGNVIQGNYIGPDPDGNAINIAGNLMTGVLISATSKDNTIGGTTPNARNVIGGCGYRGIEISGEDTSNNLVEGNYIGTDATGLAPFPNGDGIFVFGTANTLIRDNVLSGNLQNGLNLAFKPQDIDKDNVRTEFAKSTGVVSQRNLIGTDVTGNRPLGNGGHGILVVNKNQVHRIENNLIAYNHGTGVFIPDGDVPGFQILISGNSIFGNGGIGIALNQEGGSRNEQRQEANRANNGQNFPKLARILNDGQNTIITGTLAAPPREGFRVEFFFNGGSRCRPEGKLFVYSASLFPKDVSPDGSFTISIPKLIPGGYISSTATSGTSGGGNTSEFSNCIRSSSNQFRISGPIIQEVTVTANQIVARGFGFMDPVHIFLDNVEFKTKAALQSDGRGVIQTGLLVDGRSIGEAIPPGMTVRIRFRNGNGGLTEIPFKY